MYIKRAAEDAVKRIIQTFPVLLVTGPRQVGKSTMLENMAESNWESVPLDNTNIR